MALFTDANVITLDDLLEFESSLVQISSTHGIDVETKINLAVDGISDKLMIWLLKVGASDPQWSSRRALGLTTVVVTPTLHRWLCFDALARFFAEAYNVQLNTRFQGKLAEYTGEASDAAEMVFASGIGIVANPLPRPSIPSVTVTSGTALPQPMFVQTVWVDRAGNESAPSAVNGVILPAESSITVAMGQDRGAAAPATATGWNVYASSSQEQLMRQNSAPLALGAKWTLPTAGLSDGPIPAGGQQPDFFITLSKQIQRG